MPHKILNVIFIILLIFPINPIHADISNLEITPTSPEQGDTVTFHVIAQPREQIDVTVSFTKKASVSDGEYHWNLDDIYIPYSPNRFTVKATGVEKLHVSVNLFFWVTKSATAIGGSATVSQGNVPVGTYDIWIHGDAVEGASQVTLQVTARASVTMDDEGKFEFQYNTKNIPVGTFTGTAGGISKSVYLAGKGTTPPPVVDTSPPSITNPSPEDYTNNSSPIISAEYSDQSGIDLNSIRLEVDDIDVSDQASITDQSVTYQTLHLDNETSHHAKLWVTDKHGNEAHREWFFTVQLPTPPANIEVTGLTIHPDNVTAGEEITATLFFINNGGQVGAYNCILYLNEEPFYEYNLTLQGGESTQLDFKLPDLTIGYYNLSADGFNLFFRVAEKEYQYNKTEIIEEIIIQPPSEAADIIETIPSQMAYEILCDERVENASAIFKELNPIAAISLLTSAADTGNISKVSHLILEIDDNSSAFILLKLKPECGAAYIESIIKLDQLECAKKIEATIKRDRDTASQILDYLEVPQLSEILLTILELPETPSTVSHLFEVMNQEKVLEIIDLWIDQNLLDEISLTLENLSTTKLNQVIEYLSRENRLTLIPHLPLNTISKITADLISYPDLTITEIEVSNIESMIHRVVVTLKNQGEAYADDFFINLNVNNHTVDCIKIDSIPDGESLDINLVWEPEMVGNYTLEVMVDNNYNVLEINESNNKQYYTFNVEATEILHWNYAYLALILLFSLFLIKNKIGK